MTEAENWLAPGYLAKMTDEHWQRYLDAHSAAMAGKWRITAEEYRRWRDAYLHDQKEGLTLF